MTSSMTNHPLSAGRESNIGQMLIEMGKLTPEDAERVHRVQKEQVIRFGDAAQRLGLITENDIQQVLAYQFDYPYIHPGQGNYPPELVAAYHPFSPMAEALRAVRSQLMQRWFGAGYKGLAIASMDSGDGASLFTANLAVVFAQLGQRTLLIDANLRKPRQHKIFGLSGKQGLSNILAGRAGLDAISTINSFPELAILPAGTIPPNPQELLNRASFGELLETLAQRADIILYDVPAVAKAADVFAIAARTGGVLLVIRKNQTRLAPIQAFNEQLARSGAEIVGSILVDF